MNASNLQINEKETCEHSILPTDCAVCQARAFLSGEDSRSAMLPNDMKNLLVNKVIDSTEKYFIFDYRFARLDELAFEDDLVDDHPDDSHGLIPLDLHYEGDERKVRIVFVGEREACLGFLFCLLQKYGRLTMIPDGLDIGRSPLQPSFDLRYSNAHTEDCCFKRFPEASWRLSFMDEDEEVAYFATTNIEQCAAGFQKMTDLRIPGILPSEVEEFTIEKKRADHAESCGYCANNLNLGDGVDEITLGVLPQCKAYWYFFE